MESDNLVKSYPRPPLAVPFYYGWIILILSFLTTLTRAGIRSSPSVLIHPLEVEFGWSRAAIAFGVSINLLLFGVAAPISGWRFDRFGPRRVIMSSGTIWVVGLTAAVFMP